MGITKRAHRPTKTAATRERTREWLPRAAKSKAKPRTGDESDEDVDMDMDMDAREKKEEAPRAKAPRRVKATRQSKAVQRNKKATGNRQAGRSRRVEVQEHDSDSDLDDADTDSEDGPLPTYGNPFLETKTSHPTCLTCYVTKEAKDMVSPKDIPVSCRECYKNTCRGCMELYLDRYFFQSTPESGNQFPRCPFCLQEWEMAHVEKLLGRDKMNANLERMTHRTLESSPTFRWCAADRCISGQFYIPEEQLKDGNVRICCGVCESVNCYECRSVWHEGLTCKENQDPDLRKHRGKRGDVENRKIMRKSETRRCPNCSIAVEKAGGCDHVFCTSCGQDFMFSEAARI